MVIRLLALLFGVSVLGIPAASDVYGPLLGVVADMPQSLRPIRGIPGAATIGDPVALDGNVLRIGLSSRQSSAIVATGDRVQLASLEADGTLANSDLSMPGGLAPSLIAFSPSGSVSAVYDAAANALWVTNKSTRKVDLSQLPDTIGLLAVSDASDGSLAGTLRDRRSVWVLAASGSYRLITGFTEVSDLTFIGASGDLAIADRGQRRILIERGAFAGGDLQGIFDLPGTLDLPIKVSTSADGTLLAIMAVATPERRRPLRRTGVTERHNPGRPEMVLGLLRLSDLQWNAVTCDCTPVTLAPLRGNSVFLLTQSLGQPLWILDGDSGPVRLVFIPAVEK